MFRYTLPLWIMLSTTSVYAVPPQMNCHADGCVQIGNNTGTINNLEGRTLQIAINNGVINIIGTAEDKKKIDNYAEKINNLEADAREHLKEIARREQRTLTQQEQLAKATEYVNNLLKRFEQIAKDQQLERQNHSKEREELTNRLAIFDQRYALLDQIAQATTALDVTKVEQLLKQKLDLGEQLNKNYNLENARDAFQIAGLLEQRLNYMESLTYHEKAVSYDPNNAFYLEQAGLLAKILGRYDKAIEYHNKSLHVLLKTLGDDHSNVASNYYAIASNNDALGFIHYTKGEFDKAIEYYNQTIKYHKKALDIRLKTPMDNSLAISDSYSGIGVAYYHKKEYDKAIKYHNKSLNIRLKTLEPDYPAIAVSNNNLGTVYLDKGDYDKAIEHYNKSLEIMPKTLVADHPDVALSHNGIGFAYNAKGEYDKAIEHHNKSLNIRHKIFKDDHPDVANSYTNLGNAYNGKKDYAKAEDCYNKALSIRIKTDHSDTQMLKEKIRLVKQA